MWVKIARLKKNNQHHGVVKNLSYSYRPRKLIISLKRLIPACFISRLARGQFFTLRLISWLMSLPKKRWETWRSLRRSCTGDSFNKKQNFLFIELLEKSRIVWIKVHLFLFHLLMHNDFEYPYHCHFTDIECRCDDTLIIPCPEWADGLADVHRMRWFASGACYLFCTANRGTALMRSEMSIKRRRINTEAIYMYLNLSSVTTLPLKERARKKNENLNLWPSNTVLALSDHVCIIYA